MHEIQNEFGAIYDNQGCVDSEIELIIVSREYTLNPEYRIESSSKSSDWFRHLTDVSDIDCQFYQSRKMSTSNVKGPAYLVDVKSVETFKALSSSTALYFKGSISYSILRCCKFTKRTFHRNAFYLKF